MKNIIIKPHQSRRKYSLEVSTNGDIIVRTPIRSSKRVIQQLVSSNEEWIEKQRLKHLNQLEALDSWQSESHLYFHGTQYRIFQTDGFVSIFEKNRVHLPAGYTKHKFLEEKAHQYLPERCLDIAEMMSVTLKKVTLRKMRSCWGSCSRFQVIRLNTALIQVPVWVSDYVMIHECAHIVHFDHSKQFWELVEKHCHQYKDAKKWLRAHQIVLV